MAMSIPTDAIVLPLRAVFGELKRFMPRMKRIAARTYAIFVYSILSAPISA